MDFYIDRSETLHIKAYSCGSATLEYKKLAFAFII